MADQQAKTKRSSGAVAFAQLGLGMALFGSATPVSKIVGEAFPVFIGSSFRVLIGALVLLPFAVSQFGRVAELSRRDWVLLALIALFGMFGFTVFMIYGMRMVPGVVGSVVMSTTPAVTAAAAFLFMGDALDWRKVTAIALAVAGLVILHLGGGNDQAALGGALVVGSLLVFAAVCCEAGYTLLGKAATERLSPLLLTFMAAALSLPLFAPLGVLELGEVDWGKVEWHHWLAGVWWGAGTLGLGSVLWYAGVSKVAGSTAAGFMGIMPISALVLSYLLLGEPFRWIHAIGFAIVFAGVLLISWAHRSQAKGS